MREDGTLRARRARVQMATETTLETKTQLAISKELRLIACTSFDHTLMKELGQFVVIVLDKLEAKRVITETGHKPETTLVVLSRATLFLPTATIGKGKDAMYLFLAQKLFFYHSVAIFFLVQIYVKKVRKMMKN